MSDDKTEPVEGEIVNNSTGVKLTKHPEDVVQLLEAAFNHHFNITEACQYANISRETYYNWLEDDDVFAYRMSVAQTALNRKAKTNVATAIDQGDPLVSLRFLTLRDPDFKPKTQIEPADVKPTQEKIKDFLNERHNANDAGSQPTTGA